MSECKLCKKELQSEAGNKAYFPKTVRTLDDLLGAINEGKAGTLCKECANIIQELE